MNLSFRCHHVVAAHCDFDWAVDPMLGLAVATVAPLAVVVSLMGVLALVYLLSRP